MISPRVRNPYLSTNHLATMFGAYLHLAGVPGKSYILDPEQIDYSDPALADAVRPMFALLDGQASKPMVYAWSETKGSGKSLASGVVTSLYAQAHTGTSPVPMDLTVRFVGAPHLMSMLRAANGHHSTESEWQILKPLKTCDWLVLDDFAAERATLYSVEKVFEIIAHRIEVDAKTIITANLPISDLLAHLAVGDAGLSERIVDRLYEACIEVHFPEGHSFRVDGGGDLTPEQSSSFSAVKSMAASPLFRETRERLGVDLA